MALEENILLVGIGVAGVLEAYFLLKAYYEIRAAQVYRLLVDELGRLQRP